MAKTANTEKKVKKTGVKKAGEKKIIVGFVGVGSMGGPMAANMVKGGFEMVAYDVSKPALAAIVKAGAKAAKSPREVADKSDIVFGSLPNNPVCREVVLGANGVIHGKRVKIFVNLGTTGAHVARELGAGLRKHGIEQLDAPVSGGHHGAVKGSLAVMVSGPKKLFDKVEPMLKSIGTNITYVSDTEGHAQTLKLVNNLMNSAGFLITAEAFVMGVKAGLDPEVMIKVINAGTGRNSSTEDKFPREVLTRRFNYGGTVNTSGKDVKLAVAEAEEFGVPMWVGTAVRQFYYYAESLGAGPQDRTALVKYIEKLAGVEIPKTRDA